MSVIVRGASVNRDVSAITAGAPDGVNRTIRAAYRTAGGVIRKVFGPDAPREGLIAEYLFNDTDSNMIIDTSGNNVHLVNYGAEFVDALGGRGIRTTGYNVIDATPIATILPQTFELSLVVQIESSATSQSIIDIYPVSAYRRYLGIVYKPENNVLIVSINKADTFTFDVADLQQPIFIFAGASGATTWCQINAGSLQTKSATPYYSTYDIGAMGNAYNNVYGGVHSDALERPCPGFISKVRFYNRKLDPDERLILYNNGYGV